MSTVTITVSALTLDERSTPASTTAELVVGNADARVDHVDVDTASSAVVVGVGVSEGAKTNALLGKTV